VAAYYLPGGGAPARPTVRVSELVVVGDPDAAPQALTTPPAPGFGLVASDRVGDLALARYRSPAPVELPSSGLYGVADLIQPAGRS
jgi:hypothetical protein